MILAIKLPIFITKVKHLPIKLDKFRFFAKLTHISHEGYLGAIDNKGYSGMMTTDIVKILKR